MRVSGVFWLLLPARSEPDFAHNNKDDTKNPKRVSAFARHQHGVVVFLPIWAKTDPQTNQSLTLTATQLTSSDPAVAPVGTYAIAALAAASALVAIYEIFQYRKRMTQLMLGSLNLLLIAATLGASFYYSSVGERMLNVKIPGDFEAGFYLPTLALLLNLLANRFIRRDEKLVRSMDRLR
jgi:ABC-type molybdate transport system substrate-binding protein